MNHSSKDRSGYGSSSATTAVRQRDDGKEAAEAKRKLEALFGGASAAAGSNGSGIARAQQAPSGRVFANARKSTGRTPSEYRMRLERLRMAREPEQIAEAADAFLKHHQLPDEPDVLYRVLRHPSEKIVREAMGQLSSLLMQGRLASTMLLEEHLNDLSNRTTEEATRSFIEGMRHQLAALK